MIYYEFSDIEKECEKQFDKYMKSKEHNHDCIGYSEGQLCCLEKSWIKEFIRKWIKEAYDEGYEEAIDNSWGRED